MISKLDILAETICSGYFTSCLSFVGDKRCFILNPKFCPPSILSLILSNVTQNRISSTTSQHLANLRLVCKTFDRLSRASIVNFSQTMYERLLQPITKHLQIIHHLESSLYKTTEMSPSDCASVGLDSVSDSANGLLDQIALKKKALLETNAHAFVAFLLKFPKLRHIESLNRHQHSRDGWFFEAIQESNVFDKMLRTLTSVKHVAAESWTWVNYCEATPLQNQNITHLNVNVRLGDCLLMLETTFCIPSLQSVTLVLDKISDQDADLMNLDKFFKVFASASTLNLVKWSDTIAIRKDFFFNARLAMPNLTRIFIIEPRRTHLQEYMWPSMPGLTSGTKIQIASNFPPPTMKSTSQKTKLNLINETPQKKLKILHK
jgi:hypothetical protein